MKQTFSTSEKVRLLLYILIPILITQMGMYAMNFFDTMMSGRYSSNHLAGVAIGSSLWVPVYTGLSGILLGITPIIAQLAGAGRKKNIPNMVMQGLYGALALSGTVFFAGSIVLEPILSTMSLEQEVREVARDYLIGLSLGIIPLFVFTVLRSFIDALGMTRTSMIITLLALPVNALFNYVLIFGKWGFPALGGAGAGYATALTYWIVAIISIWVIHQKQPFSEYRIFRSFPSVSLIELKSIARIGIPIGLSIFFETSIFSAVTLFMSEYPSSTIAANQIAINFSTFTYTIPLSISMSLTILVGFEAGASRWKDAKFYSWLGTGFSVGVAVVCTILLFLFRDFVAAIYTNNTEVIQLAAQFLFFAALFQLSDAIQAPVQGALRGYKDVNITFFMTLISYWLIGLPVGYWIANTTSFGAYGYWVGLILGLTTGAITLSIRLLRIQRRKQVVS